LNQADQVTAIRNSHPVWRQRRWMGGDSSSGGASGGGGIEIVADVNVVLDSNSQIMPMAEAYCVLRLYIRRRGGGGSVRIIANGSVTLKGIINANGEKARQQRQ